MNKHIRDQVMEKIENFLTDPRLLSPPPPQPEKGGHAEVEEVSPITRRSMDARSLRSALAAETEGGTAESV